jgi:hypothetical protein
VRNPLIQFKAAVGTDIGVIKIAPPILLVLFLISIGFLLARDSWFLDRLFRLRTVLV